MDFEKFSRNIYNRRRSVLSVSFSSTFNVCIKKSNIEMNHQISNYDS